MQVWYDTKVAYAWLFFKYILNIKINHFDNLLFTFKGDTVKYFVSTGA